MSVLDKQNKEHPIITSNMFEVSIMDLADELLCSVEKPKILYTLEDKMKQVYSKNVLSTILNLDKHKRYQFSDDRVVNTYFSTYDSFERIYKNGVLDSLRLPIKIIATYGENVDENKSFYNLIIHILTDEAREFVIKSIQNLNK